MRNYISEVISRFLKGNYPKETEGKIQRWLLEENNQEQKEEALREYWDTLYIKPDENVYRSLADVNEKLGLPGKGRRMFIRSSLVRVAAVLIPLFMLAGGYFYFDKSSDDRNLISLTVPNGEREEMVLPDGTRVWVNGGSMIEYPNRFDGDTRTVKLMGEAYFAVIKNPKIPFIVDAEKFSVKVLGTEFNISAYPGNEKMTATVNSGLVEVAAKNSRAVRLERDQQLAYNNKTSEVEVLSVDAEEFSIWKTGHLIFSHNILRDILSSLERRFDVVFEVDEALLSREDFYSVKFVNNEDIKQVMDVLQDICGFTYSIEGKRIHIRKIEKDQ